MNKFFGMFRILIILISSFMYSLSIVHINEASFYNPLHVNLRIKAENTKNIDVYTNSSNQNSLFSLPALYDESKGIHKIIIKNLYEKNPKSKGNEVWVFGIVIDGKYIPWDQIKLNGPWEFRNDTRGFQNQVLLSYKNGDNSLTIISPVKSNLDIVVLNHDYSGKMQVTIDDKSSVVDLYNSSQQLIKYTKIVGQPKFYDYSFNLPSQNIKSLYIKGDENSNLNISEGEISTNGKKIAPPMVKVSGSIYQIPIDNNIIYKGNKYRFFEITISFLLLSGFLLCLWRFLAEMYSKYSINNFSDILNKTSFFYLIFVLPILLNQSKNLALKLTLLTWVVFVLLYILFFLFYSNKIIFKNKYNIALLFITIGGLIVRLFFLLYYPKPFGYGDSLTYLETTNNLLQTHNFVVNEYRTFGYGIFCYLIMKAIFPMYIFIIAFQHFIGVLSAILSYKIMLKITNNKLIGLVTYTIIIFLPRMIFYEHTLLTDSLIAFFIVFFFYSLINKRLVLTSLNAFFIVILRPEHLYSLCVTGLISLFFLIKYYEINISFLKRILLKLIMPCSTLILSLMIFNSIHFGFFGLTKSGSGTILHMLTAHFTDFESRSFETQKNSFKNIILESNRGFNGDNWWFMGPVFKSRTALSQTIPEAQFDKIATEISLEAITTHPMTYMFHVISEFNRFITHTTPPYDDLGAFLKYDMNNFTPYIITDKDVNEVNKITIGDDVLNKYVYGTFLDSLSDNILSVFKINLFNVLFAHLPSTFQSIVWTPIFILLLLVIILLKSEIPKYGWLFISSMASFVLLKILIHVSVTWAFERYYLHVEPIIIICCFIGIHYIITVHKTKKSIIIRQIYLFFGSIFVLIFLRELMIKKFTIFFEIDKPIIGMNMSQIIYIENYVWSNIIFYLLIIVLVWLLGIRKMRTKTGGNYE